MSTPRHIPLLTASLFALLASIAIGQTPRPTPPPEPPVKPIVSAPIDVDTNQTRIDDRIETSVTLARNTIQARSASTTETAAARAALAEPVRVELVFSKQITQAQIDAFIKAGGTIDKIFSHVSYGWTGSIPRDAATNLPSLMGPELLGVVQSQKVELHMDDAGRTGRVRPAVWNLGIDGGNTNPGSTTIAILDTGVDGTHTDLSGRMTYWKDWTSDNHPTAQDHGHHGSHVAGIATGSGAASPAGSTSINYTDLGNFPETANQAFTSPIFIPTTLNTLSWNATLNWQTGGGVSAALHLTAYPAVGSGLGSVGSSISSNVSPLLASSVGLSNPVNANYLSRYTSFPTKTVGSGRPYYAVTNTVGYAGPADGYNIFRGVAPGARWAGLKVFNDDRSGLGTDIQEAMDDVVAQNLANPNYNIRVANMSLGIVDQDNLTYGQSLTIRNKANTMAQNGVVVVISAGNSGQHALAPARQSSDPGRAHYAITVASSSDVNLLTAYSSHGFNSPGDELSGDEDMKPDIVAPGGSTQFQSNIMSVDSNTADSNSNAFTMTDFVSNDYYNIQGTSMASPYIAGVAALIIEAMEQAGGTWTHSGSAALENVLKVKMTMLMSATETNQLREIGPSLSPVLNRGAKDTAEGYGMINADAAVEAFVNPAMDPAPVLETDTFGNGHGDRRCWARRINLTSGQNVVLNLDVPGTGDFDLYLYGETPDIYGNPQILSSSVSAVSGTDESISLTPSSTQTGYVVVKRVSGSGLWTMTSPSSVDAWTLY